MKDKKNAQPQMGMDLMRFFRKSHTYIGLVMAPLLVLAGATGIMLNHTAEFGQNPMTAKIHAGLVTGGKYLVDITGAVLIYLSITGIYMWYYARARKKNAVSTPAKVTQKETA